MKQSVPQPSLTMGSNSSIPELLHSLDATTYFFVTSGLFIGVVALVFFILGLWCGGLLWRGYKRRYRAAETTIESLKTEAAQLKRRIAGQSPRTQGSAATLELSESDLSPEEEAPVESEVAPSFPQPLGRPFTLWTLPSEAEGESEPAPAPASRAFTMWTEPPAPKPVGIAEVLSNNPVESQASEPEPTPTPEPTGFTAPLLFPTHSEPEPEPAPQPTAFPPSQAFSLWTEDGWEPTPAAAPPQALPSAAFTLWTADDFQPAPARFSWPSSAAFTLWTREDFVPFLPTAFQAPPPAPPALPILPASRDALIAATASAVRSVASRPFSAEPHVTVSFPEEGLAAAARSHAFTLWTQSSGTPTPGGSGISQRSALASLIRNRVEAPPLPPLPPLDMEPLPFVPAPEPDSRAS